MTPISETFAIDINGKLDRYGNWSQLLLLYYHSMIFELIDYFPLLYSDLMNLILENGHSRVPVYYEQPTNIIGLVLVSSWF